MPKTAGQYRPPPPLNETIMNHKIKTGSLVIITHSIGYTFVGRVYDTFVNFDMSRMYTLKYYDSNDHASYYTTAQKNVSVP